MKRKSAPGVIAGDLDAEEAEVDANRQFISALARGLDVLRAFRTNDPPLSNHELSQRTKLPKPTISRITYTLTELGYLTYHQQLGCYELGGGALVLGNVARTNLNMMRKALPSMERMADFSGANVGLGTREQLNMVYVEACQGSSLVGLRLYVGSRLPLISSAMGRAYIARASSEERARVVEQLKRASKADEGLISRSVDLAMRELELHGFCISAGDWQADIHGVAVPIVAPALGGLYVLNCGGPAYSLPIPKLMYEIGPALVRTVREIEEALGVVASNGHNQGKRNLHPLTPDPKNDDVKRVRVSPGKQQKSRSRS
jgi:DNA-binding IclR family transcriptional regulator